MKRFLIPNQKGTEVYPQVTQQPTKLIIRGVQPDTPEWRMLAETYGGRLQAFHAKAQQGYALSINPISKIRCNLGEGATATYTNLQGQEILELVVDNKVLEGLGKPVEDYWDFALIELFVPSTYDAPASNLLSAAHLTCPIEEKLTAASVWPAEGLAVTSLTRVTPDRMLNTAEHDDYVRTATPASDSEAYASFTVDLRPARGLSAVTVDLHSYLGVSTLLPVSAIWTDGSQDSTDPAPGSVSGYTVRVHDQQWELPFLGPGDILNYRKGFNDYAGPVSFVDNIAAPGHPVFTPDPRTPHATDVLVMPTTHFDFGLQLWVFDVNGSPFYSQPMGTSYGGIPDPDPGPWYRHWYVSTASDATIYTGPSPVPGEVQLTLFKGVPDFSVSNYINYYRWDYTRIFPLRAGHMTIAPHVDIPAQGPPDDISIQNIYGIPKLGTVVIMLRIDLGASWQAA